MKCIPEETVDATWQAIAEMEPEQAGQAMLQLAEQQPALLQFVMEFAEDLDSDAAELCTYMVFVVYQMFSKAATSDIPTISPEQVDSQYESICRLLDQLHDNDDDDHDGGNDINDEYNDDEQEGYEEIHGR